jgi:multidrug transporter EmrE-like cation transporter
MSVSPSMLPEIPLRYVFFGLILIAITLEIAGDILLKQWSMDNKHILFWIGLLIYSIGTVFWAISLKYEVLSKAITIFTVMNLVIVAAAGVFFFKESLSLQHKLGMLLGVISVVLMEL